MYLLGWLMERWYSVQWYDGTSCILDLIWHEIGGLVWSVLAHNGIAVYKGLDIG
jgi:hypothetical protein